MTTTALLPAWEAATVGFVGGLAPDALRLLNARHDGLPTYLRTRFFWISLAGLAVLGGVVSALSHPSTLLSALALGYSAPSIVSALGAKADPVAGARVEFRSATRRVSLLEQVRHWWAR